ncbi:hypothetical protein QQS21_003879 [Conoideocrella luteorostrata]|uniref:Uncharacterized protein n=1 Tax=Conoideocrella luteorostrata TaxID=1105319 RepID=A0AAJ0CSG4_9HYPO|nr:hypothetical protein QQS21_003879 [Conoideocrella luteorostrata]
MSKLKNRPRDPPPALFLHPSPGASHVSLSSISAPVATARQHAATIRQEQSNPERSMSIRSGSVLAPDVQRSSRADSTRSTDKTDALWAEMQATLEEVELSASGGTHVFGSEHDRKLSELRSAQIGLAQAWARSEADDAMDTSLRNQAISSAGSELRNIRRTLEPQESRDENSADEAKSIMKPHADGTTGQKESVDVLEFNMKEETEVDIILGRNRREANDKYFQRVNNGVIDVVAKLEDVAVAMRSVEQESQGVWNESNIADTAC